MAYGAWGGLRTIVPENAVTDLIDASQAMYPRLAEGWEALKWTLAHSASSVGRPYSVNRQNLRLYVQADDAIANMPAIWAVYRVGEEVEILRVELVPAGQDEDE